jgi:hypothetical protein
MNPKRRAVAGSRMRTRPPTYQRRLGAARGLDATRLAAGLRWAGEVTTPKSGKARTVDMSAALRDVLQHHDTATKEVALATGEERAAWAFPSLDGTPLDRANVEKAFKRALKRAGLPPHFTPHCLRHTFASQLLQDGVSPAYVQEALGHSSIKLTVDTYGRWLRKKAPGAVDRLDEIPSIGNGSDVVAIGERRRSSASQVVELIGGPRGDRTPDLLIANQLFGERQRTSPNVLKQPKPRVCLT